MIKLIHVDDNEWEFEDDLINFSTHDELDQAIDLWHSGKCRDAEFILRRIISQNLYHIDAYHHLSLIYEKTERDFEAYLCCREAVRIGLSAIPDEFSWKSSKIHWRYLDNRPFLRAYHTLGLWLEKRHEFDESIKVFKNMLSVCPNDNIGVRYLLPKLFLEKNDLYSVISHCTQHGDDLSPEIMYTYPRFSAIWRG
jgi:tetratricopeptide (TPR) repeat protein